MNGENGQPTNGQPTNGQPTDGRSTGGRPQGAAPTGDNRGRGRPPCLPIQSPCLPPDSPCLPTGPSCRSTVSDVEAEAFLEQIVSIPSVSTQEAAVAEHIVAWMNAHGFEAQVDAAGNAEGHIGHGAKHLMLLGHIDTVLGYVPVGRDGRMLYGRGSVDAKGPFAAFCVAAARVAAGANIQVTVVGAVEEEAATSKGAYHIVEHCAPADWVVIGEPSAWNRLTLGYKGRLLMEYALEQTMAHTAGQEKAVSEQAVTFWNHLKAWADAFNADKAGRFATLDPSLREIRSQSDGLTDQVEMRIGLRLPLGLDVAQLLKAVEGWRGDAFVTTRGYEQPFRGEKRTPLTSAFLAAIRSEGDRATFVTKTGTADMNVIGPRWGCPIVAYGPGDSTLDHTPDEHIDLDEYLRSIHVLERVIQRLGTLSSSSA